MSKSEELTFSPEERSAVVHGMLGHAMPQCASQEDLDPRSGAIGQSARGLLDYIKKLETWARADERGETVPDYLTPGTAHIHDWNRESNENSWTCTHCGKVWHELDRKSL